MWQLALALPLASGLVLNHASLLRPSSHEIGHSPVLMGGAGFDVGEATRDPEAAVCPHAAAAAAAPSLAYATRAGTATTSRDYLGNAPVQGARATAAAGVAHSSVDYAAVRRELTLLMDNPSWDDGSLAPVFIRLAWHSSGTYDKASNTGGSNGAGMRYETEAADPENAGLMAARAFLEPVKRRLTLTLTLTLTLFLTLTLTPTLTLTLTQTRRCVRRGRRARRERRERRRWRARRRRGCKWRPPPRLSP